MKQIYHLPVRVEIESDNPDKDLKRIAEAMYDAVNEIVKDPVYRPKYFDMGYSIFVKADKETFAQE